jgi:hypothetical protein
LPLFSPHLSHPFFEFAEDKLSAFRSFNWVGAIWWSQIKMMRSIGYINNLLRMRQDGREGERSFVGLAPLQGSSPPLVKTILEADKYYLSVTPPK